jgi:hypothetical protein
MRRVWLIAAVAFASAHLPAQAQDQPRRWPSESFSWQPDIPECTCRAQGRDFRVGETACIRSRLATCDTVLNNTSWSMSDAPCTVSAMPETTLER